LDVLLTCLVTLPVLTSFIYLSGTFIWVFDMASSNDDWKPRLGMEFDTREEAEQFYLAYALREGFGVRVRFTNRKKDGSVSSCRFVCCKEVSYPNF